MRSSPKRLLEALTAPGDGGLSREAAQALSERIVKWSKADAIDVTINAGLNTNVRFAANQLSTAGSIVDANVAVQSAFGPKHAVVTTNDLSDEALRRTVAQAERLRTTRNRCRSSIGKNIFRSMRGSKRPRI